MPDETTATAVAVVKGRDPERGLSPEEQPAAHQLVGGVRAHQGDDG